MKPHYADDDDQRDAVSAEREADKDAEPKPTLTWPELFGYLPEITGGLTFEQWCEQRNKEWGTCQ